MAAAAFSADRPLDHERRGCAERQRPRRGRLHPRAKRSRLRGRLRRQLAQHHVELLVGRACKPCLVPRGLERGEIVFGHVDHDLGLASLAIETIGWPSATTWPTSNFTLVTTPSCDARSVVYSRRLRASSSLRASASAVASRRLRVAPRLLLVGRAHRAVVLQRLEALAIRFRLPCLRFGGGELLARRLDGELVIGVVEHRDHVALRAPSGPRRPCGCTPCRRRGTPGRLHSATARSRSSGPCPASCRSGSPPCERREAVRARASTSMRSGRRRRSPR